MSNVHRALWTFLFYALIAPFLAAVVVLTAVVLTGPLGLMPADAPPLGTIGIDAFAWSAIPAVLAGLALAPVVLRQGGFGWLIAAVAGVLAFAIAAVLFPLPALEHARPFLAFLAGLVAVAVREVLARVQILAH